MLSIRRHILLWLMPGFLLLWIGAGSALYFSVKQRYEVELDAALRELRAALPFGNNQGRSSLLSIEDFVRDDFGIYFQVWNGEGMRILKSENLGRFDLPQMAQFSIDPVYQDARLENEEPVRTLSVSSESGSLGELKIVVAKSREAADASLRKVLFAILGIGAVAGALFTVLLSYAVRSGLKPLNGVGARAALIEVDSLSERFAEDQLPGELRPIVQRLNDLIDRLQQSYVREKRFSADLAHELRTPVAALRSIAEVALKWPDQATDENYEDIKNISGELQDTIENLLTLARLENAGDQLEKKEVKLSELIKSSLDSVAEDSGLTWENTVDEDKSIITDPKIFQLILTNLFSNAAAYAPENSVVSIAEDEGSMVTVSNLAPHLTDEDVAKMFDRLWRHDKARTDSSHTGLGLSIAKSSAELLSFSLEAYLRDDFINFSLREVDS